MTKRKDGRLVRTVTDPRTGKRVYFYGATEREINRKMMEYSAKAEKGRTFEEVAKEWWGDHEPNLSLQSKSTYVASMNRAISFFKGDLIRDIRPQDISDLLRRMLKQDFAGKTIYNQRMICNLIFKYAIESGDLQLNPCANISIPKGAKKVKRCSASVEDEIIIKKSAHVWMFPFIAVYTGMRKGEILALQWKDIDFDNNLIYVSKSVGHDSNKAFVKDPKTEAGERIVPLLSPLKNELLKQNRRIAEHYILSGAEPMTKKQYRVKMKSFQEKTGTSCTAHQLRHSFATIAFECGVPAKTVQEILGHKQLSTTMDIYTDFRRKALDEAMKLLENQ